MEMAFIILLEESKSLEFLSSIPSNLFSNKNLWLVRTEGSNLGDIHFPIDSQVYTFQTNTNGIQISEVYKIDPNWEQIAKNYGSWSEKRAFGRLRLDTLAFFERRKDMMGYSFHAETMPEPPYVLAHLDNFESGKDTQIGGIWGEIWHNSLEKTMNFTTKILPSPDRQWGSLNEDGTWNGIVNELIQNRTQIGLASLFYTYQRSLVADYSPALVEGTDRMFIKYPGREASWTTYISPFHNSLWISLFIFLPFVVLLLSSTYYFGPEQEPFTFQNTCLIIWGSQFAQGSWLDPKCISSKIIFFTSFIFGVVLYTSYSAKLISFLTVIKLTLPFTSMEEILYTDFAIGTVTGSSILDTFLYGPPGSIHLQLAEEIIKKDSTNMPATIEEALAKAKNERYAFVWTTDVIYAINQDNCDFLDIPYDVNSGMLTMAWNKHLPHRHFFNYFINKMIETGQMNRMKKKWLPKPKIDCGTNGEFVSMGIENMISAFAMILIAVILAVFILTLEIIVRRREKKKYQFDSKDSKGIN